MNPSMQSKANKRMIISEKLDNKVRFAVALCTYKYESLFYYDRVPRSYYSE